MNQARSLFEKIQKEIQTLPLNEFLLSPEEQENLRSQKMEKIIQATLSIASDYDRKRVLAELNSWGPIEELQHDESISEILINGAESIWIERAGKLTRHPDSFYSEVSFRNFLDRLCHEAGVHTTAEHPSAEGRLTDFRLSLIGAELTQRAPHLTLRRHPRNPWNFQRLLEHGWADSSRIAYLQGLLRDRKNFLIVGPTGAGKTSVLNSFLQELPKEERLVVIEDTSEIHLPNDASLKLLTREDPQEVLPMVDQTQLVKRSLRLRPDRLVMGEVRGGEAKDFLMALATGHSGSCGTLHAQDAHQALLRLEMLIQMGAPQWNLEAIRRLIQLSLEYIVVVEKIDGKRRLRGIYQLTSLESNGFLLEKID